MAVLFVVFSVILNWDMICPEWAEPVASAPAAEKKESTGAAEKKEPAKPVADAASPERPVPGTVHKPAEYVVPALPALKGGQVGFAELEAARKAAVDGVIEELPAVLKELDGKTVTLTGYLVVPFEAEPVTEFYLAGGPWDGCCIGKPPTVFNSVAVTLAAGKRLANHRLWITTLTGTLHVKPAYEDGRLSGLYTLTGAEEAKAK